MNPITEGLEFVKYASKTGSGIGMAKLILSLYNSNHAFGFADCVRSFDRERLVLASKMVGHYTVCGEDQALLDAGLYVYENYPDLIELSNAASYAKSEVRERWNQERKESDD